jgi:hypothetical protein
MSDPTHAAGPPPEVFQRLEAYLEGQGMIPPDSYADWTISNAGGGSWVLTPPGMSGVLFAITPETIRPIQPARESIPEALREVGIDAR